MVTEPSAVRQAEFAALRARERPYSSAKTKRCLRRYADFRQCLNAQTQPADARALTLAVKKILLFPLASVGFRSALGGCQQQEAPTWRTEKSPVDCWPARPFGPPRWHEKRPVDRRRSIQALERDRRMLRAESARTRTALERNRRLECSLNHLNGGLVAVAASRRWRLGGALTGPRRLLSCAKLPATPDAMLRLVAVHRKKRSSDRQESPKADPT